MRIFITFVSLVLGIVGGVYGEAAGQLFGGSLTQVPEEEFVGPFASWYCVQSSATACGAANSSVCSATGNGTTDDTSAINSCLAFLSATHPVVYFPCATYKVSSTLLVQGHYGVAVIGQDNAPKPGRCVTTLKWAGSATGPILKFNGNTLSRVSRLTFDGNSVATVGVDEDFASGNFDQLNEYSDVTFQNFTAVGLRCGLTAGCANIPVIRGQFINNNQGIFAANQNALDINVWWSYFSGNVAGVGAVLNSGGSGNGNINVFGSVFLSNSRSDILGSEPYGSYRHNYSNGSGTFLSGGVGCFATNLVVQDNTIINPTVASPISWGDNGPLFLVDNTIVNDGSAGAAKVLSGCPGDVYSIGNQFVGGAISSTCSGSSPVGLGPNGGRCRSVSDTLGAVAVSQPTLPAVPASNNRTIYETSPLGSGSTCSAASPCPITTAIQSACGTSGSPSVGRNVVHLQPGNYTVSATITVPASDCQIIGDTEGSSLSASGLAGAPILKFLGPSKVVLKYLGFDGQALTADGLEIDSADQVGAVVWGQSIQGGSYSGSMLWSDQLSNTLIELHEFLQFQNATGVTNGGIRVVGSGGNISSEVRVFDGDSATNYITYNVSSDGRLLVEDCFCGDEGETNFDGVSGHRFVNLSGSGRFTFSGGIGNAYNLATDPVVAISNFTGTSAITSTVISGDTVISGSGTGGQNVLIGMVNQWKVQHSGSVTSGSNVINMGTTPSGVAAGQWVSDFSNPGGIPASLASPYTVASKTSTTVTMQTGQNATASSSGNTIGFYVAAPFSDTSGATWGNISPITHYNKNTDQNPQQLTESQSGSFSNTTVTNALVQQRSAKPTVPTATPTGVTGVELYGLTFGNCVNSIHVKA